MSTLKSKRTSAPILVLVLTVLAACGADPADPKSPEKVLLDRAIHALWGEASPTSVVALETRSTLTSMQSDFTATFDLETLLASDNCYREIRTWKDFGIREEFVQGPKKSWRIVDGSVVEMHDIETNALPESRQKWLFEISKLNCLMNSDRYKLKHKGRHKNAEGKEIERLEVRDQIRSGSQLTLDFAVDTWLVERVTLEVDASDDSLTLVLKDYRPIDGVQFPHQIDSLEKGEPFAQQRNITYKVNPEWKKEAFEAPVDLNRDAMNVKMSIGGSFAATPLIGKAADIPEAIDKLKSWIGSQKLNINGPLIVVRQLGVATKQPGVEAPQDLVAIAVKAPTPEQMKTMDDAKPFRLIQLESRRSLCLTQVGKESFAAIKSQIEKQSTGTKIKSSGSALEIYFSPEGTIRQVQIPVE